MGGDDPVCYAEAIGSPGLCAMVATHADFPGLVRRLSLEPPVRLESVTTPQVEPVTSADSDLMERIASCPHRGEPLREHQGCRCAQWVCKAGKGDKGVTRLGICLACVSGET